MTSGTRRSGLAVGAIVTAVLAAMMALGVGWLLASPGFRLAEPVPMGSTLTVAADGGTSAIYFQPEAYFSAVECTVRVDGSELTLRIDMTQQGLSIPQRWWSRGSFDEPDQGTVEVTCTGPPGGRFTIGPVTAAEQLLAAAGLALVAVPMAVTAVILAVLAHRRRR